MTNERPFCMGRRSFSPCAGVDAVVACGNFSEVGGRRPQRGVLGMKLDCYENVSW